MESYIDFLIDRWWLIVVAIIVIVIVAKLIKTVIKWLFIVAIIAVLFIYGSNYMSALT